MRRRYIIILLFIISLFFLSFSRDIELFNGIDKQVCNIVLCSINVYQDYILENIKQLLKLGNKNIYILTNSKFFDNFDEYKEKIKLIDCDEFEVQHKNSEDFWKLTSTRLFYVCEAMKKYDIKNVIHIENDVLLYYNPDILLNKFDQGYIYVPFDTFERNICSIMYIPDHIIFQKALDEYDFSKNDMFNFKGISEKTNLIKNFPIFINNHNDHVENNNEYEFVTQNYDTFNFIFDAAAMGQYIGGIHSDPNAIGFISETCIINYSNYSFVWETGIDNIKRPFILIDNNRYPIFNLHIHSKNLSYYV